MTNRRPWQTALRGMGTLRDCPDRSFRHLLFCERDRFFPLSVFLSRGTEGSNPSSSTGEPAANLAKHDKIDHPVLLQILTGQAGKSSETMQPERAAGHEVHEI